MIWRACSEAIVSRGAYGFKEGFKFAYAKRARGSVRHRCGAGMGRTAVFHDIHSYTYVHPMYLSNIHLFTFFSVCVNRLIYYIYISC